ncbi:MAG: class I SAM-dependent methyltransferase [Planctomycetota bacterium]
MTLRLQTQQIVLEGQEFSLQLPADQDEMLAMALEGEASGSTDWDPYWGLLWAAAPRTAEMILRTSWKPGLRAIELGCGIGLTGIAALRAGLQVTFTDHSSAAVSMALSNVALNGFPAARGLTFDWNEPPAEHFEFAFASDVLYDARGHQPLLRTLDHLLDPDGEAWIGDAGRTNAPRFVELARQHHWCVEIVDNQFQSRPAPEHMTFRLMMLRRRS